MRVFAYLQVMRPVNSAMTGIAVVFSILAFSSWRVEAAVAALGFVTGFAGSASAMCINDVVDYKVDLINKPQRPIPSGVISRKSVLVLSVLLLLLAIAVNAALDAALGAVVALYGLAGYSYSFARRHWWSQLIAPFSTTAPIVYGYAASGFPERYLLFAVLYSIAIFVAVLGREVVKAIMDMDGDSRLGYSTIPIKYGIDASKKLLLCTLASAPAGVLAGLAVSPVAIAYFPIMGAAGSIYGYSLYRAYERVNDKGTLEWARKYTLLAMLVGIAALPAIGVHS